MKTIRSFVRGAMSFVGLAFDEINPLYWKLVKVLGLLVLMVPIGLACNVLGYPGVNIAFSLFFASATLVTWFYPEHIAVVALTGAITKKLSGGNLAEGARSFLSQYWKVLRIVLMVETVIFFYLSFIPFAGHASVFFIIVAGSIAATLVADHLGMKGSLAMELVFYGICLICIFNFLSLVPAQSWGNEGSFMRELISNIKGSIFLFVLLLTIIVTLSKKRFTKWALILLGVTGVMFTPVKIRLPQLPWSANETPASISESVRSAQAAPTQTSRTKTRIIEGVAAQGVFSEVKIPGGCDFTSKCQNGVLMGVTHKKLPQGTMVDCADEKYTDLGVNLQDLRLSFVSTEPEQWYRVELICN